MNNVANYKHLLISILVSLSVYLFLSNTTDIAQPIVATGSITLLVAYLWISEAIPIPVTSLIPFVGFPAAGILTHKQAASALGSHVIVLLMGAFILAKGVEKSGVHKRIALGMINFIGGNSAFNIIFAFMCSAALLSMWISNTATVLALLPVVLAITSVVDNNKFKIALLLGLAYSASLGGVGTLIGTPPNIIFASVYEEFTGSEYGFLSWMKTGALCVLFGVPIMAVWLAKGIKLTDKVTLPSTGNWRTEEIRTLAVFGFIAMMWVFRKEPFGGWSEFTGMTAIGDSTIALFGVLLMFIIPNGNKIDSKVGDVSKSNYVENDSYAPNSQKSTMLLDWKTASTIPWGMLLLFAGGICIAKAFVASGLSQVIGEQLSLLTVLPTLLLMIILCLFVSFLTEITSNTATATLLMPILASAAMSNNIQIQVLMIPAVISCSCAFCLPVATAPNSIVFASGDITIKDMARQGIVLNIILALVVSLVCYFTL